MMLSRYQVAGIAGLAFISVSLQGCGSDPAGQCDEMSFEGGTVAAAESYNPSTVTCKDGEAKYTGPELACNWVGVNCFESVNVTRTCGIVFAFGEKGTGLTQWPVKVNPSKVDSKDKLPAKTFKTEETGAEFSKIATKNAERTIRKKLAAAVENVKVKAAAAAKKVQKKAEAVAKAAKKKAEEAAALAKKKIAAAKKAATNAATKEEAAEEGKAATSRRLFFAAAAKDGAGPIAKSQLKCVSPKAKGDAKDASRLYTESKTDSLSAAGSSGWMLTLGGMIVLSMVGIASWKIVRTRFSRARIFDRSARDLSDIEDEMIE